MVVSKEKVLQPILKSSDGIHLTAYVPAWSNMIELRKKVREIAVIAEEYLSPVMSKNEISSFLEPIEKLTSDAGLLKNFIGNLAIFRTKNSIRILSVPIEVEFTCVVATTFHIKPLLRWVQQDKEFLFLGLSKNYASLYSGTQSSFSYLDDAIYPESLRRIGLNEGNESLKELRKKRTDLEATMKWLAGWVNDMTQKQKPTLFLAGDNHMVRLLAKHLKYENLYPESLYASFDESKTGEIRNIIRAILRKEARYRLEQALVEFWCAEDLNLAKKNIFQIAKAAVAGKVKKLIIADDFKIFGKLNKKTGCLSINPVDLDHEDDDILDDLAQTVLNYGGEVIVAKRDEIPKGRPILAILEAPDSEVSPEINPERRAVI
jgi:hypothetical protein